MDKLAILQLLPTADWLALAWFFAMWLGYAMFARRRAKQLPSLVTASDKVRYEWMHQATYRDVRVFDAVVIQNLTSSPSFFASTTILIIGGLLAVLGTTEQTVAAMQDLPFAARTSAKVFDLKVFVLIGIFVYAFFRFTWSLRQYNIAALIVASASMPEHYEEPHGVEEPGHTKEKARHEFARRASGVISLAADTFNDGMRAYYLAFATVAWFFSPLAFAVSSTLVAIVLYHREFRSQVLTLLRG